MLHQILTYYFTIFHSATLKKGNKWMLFLLIHVTHKLYKYSPVFNFCCSKVLDCMDQFEMASDMTV